LTHRHLFNVRHGAGIQQGCGDEQQVASVEPPGLCRPRSPHIGSLVERVMCRLDRDLIDVGEFGQGFRQPPFDLGEAHMCRFVAVGAECHYVNQSLHAIRTMRQCRAGWGAFPDEAIRLSS
jgi:hypothetical protein